MRLLDRYLLRELLIPLGYCLGGFLLIWIAFDLLGELNEFQTKRLLPRDIAEYYLLITPEFLVFVLPIALLLALLYTLTNHARHHELTAVRAAGVSLWRLCLPYWAVGLLSSVLLFALNELWVPNWSEAAEQVLTRRLERLPGAPGPHQEQDLWFKNFRDGRVWRIGLYNSDTSEMINPLVVWTLPDRSSRYLAAERAIYTNGVWAFFNVRTYKQGGNTLASPSLQATVQAYPEFTETPEQIKSEIRLAHSRSVRGARRADLPIAEIINYLRLHPAPTRAEGSWLYTKLHGRLAAPWTCLVVVFIAIPFGAASGRRNIFVGVAGSIVIIFVFFVLQQLGLALGTGGYLPAWLAAWLPNLSFALAGLGLAARVR